MAARRPRPAFGALVKLDDKVADIKDDIVGWEEFTGADGGIYAIPLSIQGFVIYYNKKLYTDAGLDPENPPKTWAELTKVCDAIKAKGAVPCFAMGNKEGFGIEFWFSAIAANAWTARGAGGFRRRQAEMVEPAGQGDPAELGRCQQGRLVPAGRRIRPPSSWTNMKASCAARRPIRSA